MAFNAVRTRNVQLQSRAIRDSIITNPYAWPGGYSRAAVASDGGLICAKCCESERKSIGFAYPGDGWDLVSETELWGEEEEYCSHCGELIK